MSRIINIESVGKQRTQLTKAVALALRELSRQTSTGTEAQDLAAFIAIALETIAAGIDSSVAAWEKRGYWVKADRFRMDWAWAAPMASQMDAAVKAGDWPNIALLAARIASHLGRVLVSDHHRLGKPWRGAFERMKAE